MFSFNNDVSFNSDATLELNIKSKKQKFKSNQAAKVAGTRLTKLKEIWNCLDFEINRPGQPIFIPTDNEIEEVKNYKKNSILVITDVHIVNISKINQCKKHPKLLKHVLNKIIFLLVC